MILGFALLYAGAARADKAAAFFEDGEVREIRLYFDDANWYNTLYQAHARNAEDPYFPCRLKYGDTVIERIGCRFKGNSSFQRNGIKKPFKLDFNEYDENARFLGLKKLNLHNFDLSPDFMREKLLHDMAGRYVAALRSVYVKLFVNDAYYGLYLAVEQPDKTMMESRFGDSEDGNLYEAEERMGASVHPDLSYLGSDPAAYRNVYLLETNEEANDFSGLIEFLDVLNNTPTADLPASIEPICDVENWMYGMALNNLVVNLDSYLGVAAEYYLYDRTKDGKFIHIQWDHNESFGITGDGTPQIAAPSTFDPFYLPTSTQAGGPGMPGGGARPGGGSTARPLLQKLWAVDAYQRMYLQALSQFLRESFNPETMSARIQQLADLIREHVRTDPNKAYSNAQFETAVSASATGVSALAPFISARYNFLRTYLNAQASPTDVRLNEVVTANAGTVRDEAGEAEPWVELYNPGPGPVTLDGFYLTDDPANPTRWQVPARRLADGEYLLLWLDGETAEGQTHAGFRPQTAGGSLYLYASAAGAGKPLDSVTYGALAEGQSFVRMGLLGSRWEVTGEPTAGAANVAAAEGSAAAPATGQLFINELMADNKSAFADPDEPGACEDWVEIYNPGGSDVDMGGMYLTDDPSNPAKYKIPQGIRIPARGYLVFWADNDTSQGPLHANFALSKDGEKVALYQPDGKTLIDSVTFPAQQENYSYGRAKDGAAEWKTFFPATPGAAN